MIFVSQMEVFHRQMYSSEVPNETFDSVTDEPLMTSPRLIMKLSSLRGNEGPCAVH